MKALAKVYFWPFGRLSRLSMWRFGILYPLGLYAAATIIAIFVFNYEYSPSHSLYGVVAELFLMIAVAIVSIKRFHDIGLSGWWYVVLLMVIVVSENLIAAHWRLDTDLSMFETIVGWGGNSSAFFPELFSNASGSVMHLGYYFYLFSSLVAAFLCLIVPGSRGENKYGPDPLERN